MISKYLKFLPSMLCLLGVSNSYADLPLAVEGLLTEAGSIKLDLGIAYANRSSKSVATAEPVMVQTSTNSFVTLPSLLGEGQDNTDTLIGTLALRYGLTAKTEIYSRASYLYGLHPLL